MPDLKFAFRCKSCGHLHTADDAGEAAHPHACRVCGAGVVFGKDHEQFAKDICNPELTPEQRVAMAKKLTASSHQKTVHSDNWEVLANAPAERLGELGLKPEDVIKHTPWTRAESLQRNAVHVAVTVEESMTAQNSAVGK